MSPRECSVHTHTTLCDGRSTPAEMAASAFEKGVKWYGFSGHSHTPVPYDAENVMPADLSAYRAAVLEQRALYEGRMEVLLGIEQDSQNPDPVPDWMDYWIGSVHNLYDPETGKYHAMDWDAEKLRFCRDEMFHGDALAMTEGYFRDVGAMAERKPTILGHIDLITKLNGDGSLFDEEAVRYRQAALEALHRADPEKTLLEINTGAISRGYRKTPYPAPFLLKEWRAMGGRVILTADAHHADHVIYGYDLAAEAARTAGFTTAAVLTLRGPEEAPL